jgi:hypothetical protein
VWKDQLYLENFRRNVPSFQLNLRRSDCRMVEDLKLGQLVKIFIMNLDDMMDEDPQ